VLFEGFMQSHITNFTNNTSFENQTNNIEQILSYSANLFMQTGMPDLAKRWQKILDNYHRAKNQQ
jgi:hypothetical protein